MLALSLLVALPGPYAVAVQEAASTSPTSAWVERTTYTSELGLAAPGSVTFDWSSGKLFLSDVTGSRLLEVALDGELINETNVLVPGDSANVEVIDGAVVTVTGNRLLVVDDRGQGGQSRLHPVGVLDPSGLSWDPISGETLILDGQTALIARVNDSGEIGTLEMPGLQGRTLSGLAYNPSDRLTYVSDPAEGLLFGIDDQGAVESTYTYDSSIKLGGMTFAPSADPTDEQASLSLYVVDEGEEGSSGRLLEMSLSVEPLLAATNDIATLVNEIRTYLFDPPSPDSSGITYIDDRDHLFISDSEVNEMNIFQNVNLFEATRAGSLVDTGVTIDWSNEPTGVSYNPANGHLFVSDDGGSGEVYEVDPGPDNRLGTGDDIVTFMDLGNFASDIDSEGIAYDPASDDLFVTDGVGKEIWRISPGPNGIFDGGSPDGDDTATHFDVEVLGMQDPEGIDVHSSTGTLFIVDRREDAVFEVTKIGALVRIIDISVVNPVSPAGIVVAPSSLDDGTYTLYVAARGVDNGADPNENDGMVYEFAVSNLGGSNTPPVGVDDSYSVSEDAVLSVAAPGVLGNDSDSDGDPLTVSVNTGPSNGSVTLNSDGSFSYTPNPDFFGLDAFTYDMSDATAVDTATVSITVNPLPDPPVANDDIAVTSQNTAVVIAVTANDTDVDGDVLGVTNLSVPSGGSVVDNGDGAVTYTPNTGFTGSDSFTYTANDSVADSNVATVSVTVTVSNDPPVASDDTATIDEDTVVVVDVAANDTDVDGNLDATTANTTCAGCADPTSGSLVNNGDGTFGYTPNLDFNGSDGFTYEICDMLGACDTATATITINSVNDSPVANDDSATTDEDTAVVVDVAANDTDVDGNLDATTANTVCVGCADPTSGSLVNNGDGTFGYTPNTGFNGSDGFTYEICDSLGACDTAIADLTVSAAQVIFASSTSSGTAGGVSFKDEDVLVYDTATASWAMYFDGSDVGLGTKSQEVDAFHLLGDGSVLLSLGSAGTIPDVGAVEDNDIIRFIPTSTGDVTAGSFELYLRGDDFGLATEDIDAIGFDPAGRLVVSTRGSYSVSGFRGGDEDLIVLDSGSWQLYFDGSAVALTLSNEDTNGTWIAPNGDVYITVRGSFDVGTLTGDGADIFVCQAGSTGPITSCSFAMFWDGSDPANGFAGEVLSAFFVSGNGLPTNDPPVANDDSATTAEDTVVSIDVAANDTDADGNLDATNTNTACVGCVDPTSGALTNNGDGTFGYTPNANFNGSDSFTYEICDILGACDTAVVSITINPVNDPPVASDDTAVTSLNTAVIIAVTANDTDVDGDVLGVTNLSAASSGTLTDNGDGTVTYTPDLDFNGSDSFTYTANDSVADSNVALVSITVTVPNDPPVASDDTATIDEDTAVVIDVGANDTDVDGNLDATTANTTCAGCADPTSGSLVNNGDGTFGYTPNLDFNGSDGFTYEICDTLGACDIAVVSFTVNPIPDQPVANNDSATTDEDTAVVIDVAANDTDVDGNLNATTANTVCVGCADPTSGSLVNNGDGTFTYTPNPGFNGSDSFSYEICDTTTPTPLCDTASADVAVAGGTLYYMSFDSSTNVPGIGYVVRDEDVIVYDPSAGVWAMYFDASDVGITSKDLDALHVRDDGSVLMSFSSAITVPGLTGGPAGELVDENDVFLFTPISTGDNTAGSFSFYFDGSDVGLDTTSEDIDGLHEFADGSLGISTTGSSTVVGLTSPKDEDILRFTGTYGSDTAGTWSLYFDGSDVGFTISGDDLDAIAFDDDIDLLFSTKNPYAAAGGVGDDEDISRFTGNFGDPTSGSAALELDISTLGINPALDLDALAIQ